MIVITVISILVGFAITQYSGLTPEARMVKARQDMNSLSLSLDNYAIRHGGRYPTSLGQLETEMGLEVPDTPWGHKYWIDRYYVYCFIPLKDYSSGMSTPQRLRPGEIEKPPTTVNTIRQLYRNTGSLVLQAGQNVIVQQAVRGSQSAEDTGISSNFGKGGVPRWYKRGYSVVYQTNSSAGSGIYIETLGGEQRVLETANWNTGQESNLTGDYPSPSPDGDSLVFTTGGNLNVYSLTEGRTTVLGTSADPIKGNAPAWSPHTDLIAFIPGNNKSGDLAITTSRAKHPVTDVKVLVDDMTCSSPAWHPSGQMLGFVCSGGIIHKIPVTGQGGPIVVFDSTKLRATAFAWSPDGNLIAIADGAELYIWSIDWNQASITDPLLASIKVYDAGGTINSISW